MVREVNQLSFSEVDLQMRFKVNTTYHKAVMALARRYGVSPYDLLRMVIGAAYLEMMKDEKK